MIAQGRHNGSGDVAIMQHLRFFRFLHAMLLTILPICPILEVLNGMRPCRQVVQQMGEHSHEKRSLDRIRSGSDCSGSVHSASRQRCRE